MSQPAARVAGQDNARLKALEPQLDGLRQRWRSSPDPLTVPEIRIGSRELELSAWEWSQVGIWLQDPQKDDDRPSWLVSQGIALQIKILNDLERLEAVQSEEPAAAFGIRGELMLDTAVGRSLVRKTQNAINALLSAGDMKSVQEMTPYLHRLRNTTFEVRGLLQGNEQQQADSLVDAIDAPQSAPSTSKPQAQTSSAAAKTGAPGQRRAPQPIRTARPVAQTVVEQPGSRTGILVAALAVALIVRFVGFGGLLSGEAHPSAESMTHVSALGEAQSRWPSAFVTVTARDWKATPTERRTQAIQAAAADLSDAGFTGLFVRTDDGEPVGRWSKITGVELIDATLETAPAGGGGTAAAETTTKP
ncbi:hypothetical protein ABI59_22610 [Acidobacteria bacterium Mor1]|nr:hypothetical protein ABI59_22610 [Acidobacteria bacterium Mor1]